MWFVFLLELSLPLMFFAFRFADVGVIIYTSKAIQYITELWQEKKEYVQDVILAHADQVWQLLFFHHAYVFVAG